MLLIVSFICFIFLISYIAFMLCHFLICFLNLILFVFVFFCMFLLVLFFALFSDLFFKTSWFCHFNFCCPKFLWLVVFFMFSFLCLYVIFVHQINRIWLVSSWMPVCMCVCLCCPLFICWHICLFACLFVCWPIRGIRNASWKSKKNKWCLFS